MGRRRVGLVFGVWALMLLVALFGVVLNVTLVTGDETIYVVIWEDGSVDPSTVPILNVGNVFYKFTDNLNGSIVVRKPYIVIDGAGYTLQGPGSGNGIDLIGTSHVTIQNMNIKSFEAGIFLGYSYGADSPSADNRIVGNNITSNGKGIYGFKACGNRIVGNNITNNGKGILLTWYSYDNSIAGNNIVNNNYGILQESGDDKFYHNNFINNTIQVSTIDYLANVWDDGYLSGGNYWSDYSGTDLYSGPYQNETGNDGIGDTPLIIDSSNIDNYPLVSPEIFSNLPPIASFTYQPASPITNEMVSFNASNSYDPDGSIASYVWHFGDGNITTVTTPLITHQYNAAGNYTVVLIVIDNYSLTSAETAIVRIKDPSVLSLVAVALALAFATIGVCVIVTRRKRKHKEEVPISLPKN